MTISAAVLEAMVKAGCSAEQLIAVVKAEEETDAEKLAIKREQTRIRVQRHRAARNASNALQALQRVTSVTAEKLNEISHAGAATHAELKQLTTEPNNKEKEEGVRKRAARLPNDWSLPKEWHEWARKEGYAEDTIKLEAAQFGNYWQAKAGKDACKLDWEKTWHNWMLKAPKPKQQQLALPKITETREEYIRRSIQQNQKW